MLNIWGRISSINVRKVVWCAQELGLDFQRTEAGGKFGVVQTPEYLRLNPNALVPAIDDGEGEDRVMLWESNVIVRYLCAKHSMGKLYPEPLAAALRCRALDGLAADHAQPGQRRRLQAMDPHAAPTAATARSDRVFGSRHRAAVRAARRPPRHARVHARRPASRWPTSRSAAKRTAGSGCRRPNTRGPPGRTSSAGSPTCAARAGARGVLDLALE